MNNYTQEYIDACRSSLDEQLALYRKLVASARGQAKVHSALDAFEPRFFNNMVVVLDTYFCHRSRTIEGKDGNPLNEVRVLCSSMLLHGGVMTAEKSTKLSPANSLLKYEVGDEIKLSEADFAMLSKAFFAEVEAKFL